jgi:polysaccharide biosynthesis/export protein
MLRGRAFLFGSTGAVIAFVGGVLSVALFAGNLTANAQAPAKTLSRKAEGTTVSASPPPTSDPRYRIGPGDILEVRVLRTPELSRDAVRVDERGMIRLPLIDNDVRAACLTEGELGKKIATLYADYKRDPRVDIFIKEYNSQPVAVIGAVNLPGRYLLSRSLRLSELLAYAGGPKDTAGDRVLIAHIGGREMCDERYRATTAASGGVTYTLSSTVGGEEDSNPYVQPGDIVNVPEAKLAFVVGNVFHPSTIPLKEPIMASRAIAMAGGALPDSRTRQVRISRQAQGSPAHSEIIIDLVAIKKHQAEDVLLQPGDIVEVPSATGKKFIRAVLGTIVPTVTQLPVYAVRRY